jgi:hypothetical protein
VHPLASRLIRHGTAGVPMQSLVHQNGLAGSLGQRGKDSKPSGGFPAPANPQTGEETMD